MNKFITYILAILAVILSLYAFGHIHHAYISANSNFFDADNIFNGAINSAKMMGPHLIYKEQIYDFYGMKKETFMEDIYLEFLADMIINNSDKIAFYFNDIDKLDYSQKRILDMEIVKFMKDDRFNIREIPADYSEGLFNVVKNRLYLIERKNHVREFYEKTKKSLLSYF